MSKLNSSDYVRDCPQCGQHWIFRGNSVACSTCGLPGSLEQVEPEPELPAPALPEKQPELPQVPLLQPEPEPEPKPSPRNHAVRVARKR